MSEKNRLEMMRLQAATLVAVTVVIVSSSHIWEIVRATSGVALVMAAAYWIGYQRKLTKIEDEEEMSEGSEK